MVTCGSDDGLTTPAYVDALDRRDDTGDTWDRLTEIKERYDPANLFRHNQNIPPAT